MKYVCRICGYVYDEEKEKVKFSELPENWKCPLCGAPKIQFQAQNPEPDAEKKIKPVSMESVSDKELSYGEIAAVCANLARGCEKQYRFEEQKEFLKLAEYFNAIQPAAENVFSLSEIIERSINDELEAAKTAAVSVQDRGAMRALVWGEKVTRMLGSLIERYEKEGGAFLENTDVFVCTICGFIYLGNSAPELCPVCKVPSWKFEKIGG